MAVPFNNGMRNMGPPQFGPSPGPQPFAPHPGAAPVPPPPPIDQADQAALHAAILNLHRQTLDAIVKHHRQSKQQQSQTQRY